MPEKIGLALGGGGAKGFAHLAILEVFDELGVRPSFISGTSIGAVIGALYASGLCTKSILEILKELFPQQKNFFKEIFFRKEQLNIFQLLDPNLRGGGFLKGEKILGYLYNKMHKSRFEDLEIPLCIVSTDFWRHREIVFRSGNLLTAIRASMAIPYLFAPVVTQNCVLVDGGLVNNLPFDLLPEDCDITIAVDIAGEVSTPKNKVPSLLDSVFHSYQVMMDAMSQKKLEQAPIDIYIRPPIIDIDMLDFHKSYEIYEQGLSAKKDFQRRLVKLLESDKLSES